MRNPFNQEAQPREQQGAEDYSQISTKLVIHINRPDGSIREVPIQSHISRPNGNGTWNEIDVVNVIHDEAGNPMIVDDPQQIAISHSGLFITSPDKGGVCTSKLHPTWLPRNFLIDQDGKMVGSRGVCSHCMALMNRIQIILGVIGIGILMGVYKALGWF